MQKTMNPGMSKTVVPSKTRLAMALARTLPKMVSSALHRNILDGRFENLYLNRRYLLVDIG